MLSDRTIESYWRVTDGEDWWCPVMRAQMDPALPDPERSEDIFFGFTLRFAARTYHFSRPIHLIRSMRLTGAGSGYYGGTRLCFDLRPVEPLRAPIPQGNPSIAWPLSHRDPSIPYRDATYDAVVPEARGREIPARGIIAHSPDTARHAGYEGDAYRAVIENLSLDGAEAWRTLADAVLKSDGDGIAAYTRINVRDVTVMNFRRDGIRIAADVKALPARDDERLPNVPNGAASFWSLEHTRVQSCGGDAIHLMGPDVNGGVAHLLDASDNNGWGVHDESWLGNSFLTCGTHHNGHQLVAWLGAGSEVVRNALTASETSPVHVPGSWRMPGLISVNESATRVHNYYVLTTIDQTPREILQADYHRIDQPEPVGSDAFSPVPDSSDRNGVLFAVNPSRLTLGGSYVVHVATRDERGVEEHSAVVLRIEAKEGGPFRNKPGGGNFAQFYACYAEADQPASEVFYPGQLIGGLHSPPVDGNSFTLRGELMSSHKVLFDYRTPGGRQEGLVQIGDHSYVPDVGLTPAPGAILAVQGSGNQPEGFLAYQEESRSGYPYRGGWWGFNHLRGDNTWMLNFPLGADTTRLQVGTSLFYKQPRMAPAFPQSGFYLYRSWFGATDGPPASGTWDKHDLVINPLCDESGPWHRWLGAVCVQAGTSGTYDEHFVVTANGDKTLTLSGPPDRGRQPQQTDLKAGDYVILSSIAGTSPWPEVRSRIVEVTAVTNPAEAHIGLEHAVPYRGTGVVIRYDNPVWRLFGKLEEPAEYWPEPPRTPAR